MMGDAQPMSGGPERVLPWPQGDEHPLIDSLNDAVIVADDHSRILYANPATTRLLGWAPGELRGSSLLRLIPERLRRLHEAAFAQFVSSGVLKRGGQPMRLPALCADGTEVPIELLTSTVERSEGGALVVGTLRDVRDRVDIERHRQVADQLLGILARGGSMAEAAPRVLEAIGQALDWDVATLWIAEPGPGLRCRHLWHAGDVSFDRFAAASRETALAADEGLPGLALMTSMPVWIVDLADSPDFPRRQDALADGLRTALAVPIFADGVSVGVVELLSREMRQREAALLDAMATIGERLGPFLVRVQAEEERQRLLADVEAAGRAQEFVLNASRAMAEVRGYRRTLERLAALAVPTLGDLCLIDVLDEHGRLRRMAARHADPERQAVVDMLKADHPPEADGNHPVIEVIRSGRSSWSPEMPADFLRRATRDDRHYELAVSLGCTSYMTVPLIAGTTVLGAVTVVSAGSGRRFSHRDLALAESLASQVAAVVDNARAYDAEHRIAHILQQSLLPDHLSVPDELDVAARYLPATKDAEIGGDWYDVFPLTGGRVACVVGDVEGHDLIAASVMGQLRSVLRAYAFEAPDPAEILRRLSQFALKSELQRLATVLVMVLDLETGEFFLASAGHHAPLLVDGVTVPRLLTVPPGPPVGVEPQDHENHGGQLEIGDALIMYTDGLVENRSTTAENGTKRVADIVANFRGDPERMCAALEQNVADRIDRDDDIAFLILQRRHNKRN